MTYGDDKPEPRHPEPLDVAGLLRGVADAIDRPSSRERRLARDLDLVRRDQVRLIHENSELLRRLLEAQRRCNTSPDAIVLTGAEAAAYRALLAANRQGPT